MKSGRKGRSKEGKKEKSWLPFFVIYVKNPKKSRKILLGLIYEFNKVTGYNVNIQKSSVFLYSSSYIGK